MCLFYIYKFYVKIIYVKKHETKKTSITCKDRRLHVQGVHMYITETYIKIMHFTRTWHICRRQRFHRNKVLTLLLANSDRHENEIHPNFLLEGIYERTQSPIHFRLFFWVPINVLGPIKFAKLNVEITSTQRSKENFKKHMWEIGKMCFASKKLTNLNAIY